MKIKTEQLKDVFSLWFSEAILSKATAGQQLILSFIWNQGKDRMFDKYKPYIDALSEDGYFELGKTKENALAALNSVGGKYEIPLINYIVDAEDVNLFFKLAEKYAVK